MTVSVNDTAPKFYSVTFTMEGLNIAASITKAQFVPDSPTLQMKTLAGPRSASGSPTWTLELEGAQDYHEIQNVCNFLTEHDGEDAVVVLVWTGTNGETSQRSATIVCKSTPWGGVADELATFSISLPVTGNPTATDSAGS